ncbi:DNA polymerase III subunit delta [Desulfoscipio geothermicus]|uniref:DNA polymerase III subunit delta n=1 Tax=Desulfoscipio geothermicus DSM 3669 TaxID=1121426 RepID=A0A1I6D2L1_9FIRM|nr:DNA polymerase III subunit delta [Desulfoscipio geothermicus]SFQ99695.1 DNA polymerase III, delta subunit [Desulfoscipio geothermicus DSM 3669]
MKYFLDFLAQLKGGDIAPVYLFYGPENYLRDQAIRRLREAILPPGGEELNYEVLDGTVVTGRDIAAAAGSTPFVKGRRLVVVRNTGLFQASGKKKESDVNEEHFKQEEPKNTDVKQILEYLSAPCAGTCLVFATAQSVDKRKKIYKETARVGRAIEFAGLKPTDLVKWLAKLAREAGCSISREAAQELMARCGRDMYTLYNEMNKLTCYVGPGKTIDPETVRELVTGQLEENIFEVVDAIGAKNVMRALAGIRNLLLQKHQAQQITGMVARQFRLILQVKELAGAGHTREDILSALKLHPFVHKKISAQKDNFQTRQLVWAINNLTELDYRVKTGQAAFFTAMETFILKICAEK